MQTILTNIASSVSEKTISPIDHNPDCKDILEDHRLSYRETGYYLQVGKIEHSQGWILHISSIRAQFITLLKAVLPVLVKANLSFKIPKDTLTVKYLLDGAHGNTQLGKLICVYPFNEETALELAKILIGLTQGFRAPSIPTDSLLGGTVFTMYGSSNIEPAYYTIPFVLPKGISWPFDEIAQPVKHLNKQLWNYKYRPLAVIKPDPKGRVIRGNYFKSLFNIKYCLIKEGKKNMWADDFERDITDRIEWQYELYKDLSGDIPAPKIFDLFWEQDNIYLVMEFIKGVPLDHIIMSIYKGNSWLQLLRPEKMIILDYLQEILIAIEKLHEKGYVHRDITPANFLVNKKGHVFLIDMELAYSTVYKKPSPVFKLGTAGFMSPEQMAFLIPTIKEDIYALGALMLFAFTGLSPLKIDINNTETNLTNHLNFFTKDREIICLIEKCLDQNPAERPTLRTIKHAIEIYRNKLSSSSSFQKEDLIQVELDPGELNKIITGAIKGLSNPLIMTPDHVWHSRKPLTDTVGLQSMTRIPQAGIYTGMTGVLYLLAIAKRSGFTIDSCIPGYFGSWKYVEEHYLNPVKKTSSGLYNGLAGIALAISEGLDCGLLNDIEYAPYLESCFDSISSKLDLGQGIAGQGIALLKCRQNLNPEFYEPLFQQYIAALLANQQRDGCWINLVGQNRKNDNITGLAYGTAGILYFLMTYASDYNDNQIATSIEKGLDWLYKKANKQKGGYYWNISTKDKSSDPWGCSMGTPGIIVTFIKAYELLKKPLYKKIAESALSHLPKQPVHIDYTQSYGLSGLGEVYMEAHRVFMTEEWRQRVDWIANTFYHTCLPDKEKRGCHWSVDLLSDIEPDLMTGSSGIIHFLMRYQMKDKIGFLLLDQ